MAINPEEITTIRVDQLAPEPLALASEIAHVVGTELKKDTIQSLVDLVATSIGVTGAVGFLAITVTDGQQLPNVPTEPSFFLCGVGTFLNINGYPDVICTENMNAIMSLTDHWELGVQIAINPLSGTVQSVTGSAVDNTDPLNPIVNLPSGAGVETVTGTLVDDTDPLNPIINIPTLEQTTTAGNTTTNSIYSRADIATIDVAQENGVGFKDDYTGLRFIKDTKNADIISDDVVTNYTIKLPNKSEASVQTMAMVSDITGGDTDLAYTPSPTNGIVTSSTGTDATLPLADATDAGLLKPAKFTVLENTSGTNTGDNATNTQYSGLQAQVDLRTRELLQDFTDYTTTAVLTEQIISNQAITASDMKINSWLNFISTFSRTGTTTATVAIYLNTTSNSLVGAVKIGTATMTSTGSLPCFKRDFSINASSVLRGFLFSSNSTTDEVATVAQSTTTLTLASGYFLISTVTLNNTADTVTQRAINLKSSK